MKPRSLLVGTAGWAETHAKAYELARNVELVGVCGHRDMDQLNRIADAHRIPVSGMDLGALILRVEPDMLDVACNPHFRLDAVRAAAGTSIKLVNLEKPMALTPSEAYEIERICREHRLLLTVNHQKKYLPAWREAARIIASGELGELAFLRATCRGNLLEQGTHLIDMILHYAGNRQICWVMGQIDDLEGLGKEGASAPDSAAALICFDDDLRALVTCGNVGHCLAGETNKWHQFAVEAYGSRGKLTVTLNRTLAIEVGGEQRVLPSSWDEGYIQAVADHLDDAALYAQEPTRGHISDLEHSLASFQAVMAVYASGAGGGRIALPTHFDDSLIDRLQAIRRARG